MRMDKYSHTHCQDIHFSKYLANLCTLSVITSVWKEGRLVLMLFAGFVCCVRLLGEPLPAMRADHQVTNPPSFGS